MFAVNLGRPELRGCERAAEDLAKSYTFKVRTFPYIKRTGALRLTGHLVSLARSKDLPGEAAARRPISLPESMAAIRIRRA